MKIFTLTHLTTHHHKSCVFCVFVCFFSSCLLFIYFFSVLVREESRNEMKGREREREREREVKRKWQSMEWKDSIDCEQVQPNRVFPSLSLPLPLSPSSISFFFYLFSSLFLYLLFFFTLILLCLLFLKSNF